MEYIPCEFCNQQILFSNYQAHLTTCLLNNGIDYIYNFFRSSNNSRNLNNFNNSNSNSNIGLDLTYINKKYPKMNILEKQDCIICLQQIKGFCRELDCRHTFCVNCIDKWLSKNNKCPICCKKL